MLTPKNYTLLFILWGSLFLTIGCRRRTPSKPQESEQEVDDLHELPPGVPPKRVKQVAQSDTEQRVISEKPLSEEEKKLLERLAKDLGTVITEFESIKNDEIHIGSGPERIAKGFAIKKRNLYLQAMQMFRNKKEFTQASYQFALLEGIIEAQVENLRGVKEAIKEATTTQVFDEIDKTARTAVETIAASFLTTVCAVAEELKKETMSTEAMLSKISGLKNFGALKNREWGYHMGMTIYELPVLTKKSSRQVVAAEVAETVIQLLCGVDLIRLSISMKNSGKHYDKMSRRYNNQISQAYKVRDSLAKATDALKESKTSEEQKQYAAETDLNAARAWYIAAVVAKTMKLQLQQKDEQKLRQARKKEILGLNSDKQKEKNALLESAIKIAKAPDEEEIKLLTTVPLTEEKEYDPFR